MKLSLDAQPISITQIICAVIALTILVLGGLTWHYRSAYQSKSETLKTLQQSVANQNKLSAEKLKTLTTERDAKQTLLNKQAKDQGIKDEQAQTDIATLHTKLLNTPIRVQYMSSATSSSRATIDAAANAANRATDEGSAYGILPQSNTEHLADALTEIETLNAAFGSCKARLIPP